MKKILAMALVLMMILSLAACGSGKDDDKKDDKTGTTNSPKDPTKPGDKPGNNDPVASGPIVGVTGDKEPLPVGSQAHDYWHAATVVRNYEFDNSGKCLKDESIYYLDDPANKDAANDHLTGGNWEPIWSADNTYFSINSSFISYTDTDDAIDYFESHYYAYTITYDNGATKRVEAATEEEKIANVQKIFGLKFDEVKGLLGDPLTIATWQRDTIQFQMYTGATLEQMNELCGKLFEVCKPLAEDGNMYTYLGKYGDVITEAPKEESEFSNAEFHYYYGGKEIKVSVGISQANDKMLQLHIGIVK